MTISFLILFTVCIITTIIKERDTPSAVHACFSFFNWSRVGKFVFGTRRALSSHTFSVLLVLVGITVTNDFLPFLGYLSWGTLKTPHDDDDTSRAYGRHTRHRFSLHLYLVSNPVFFSSTSLSLPMDD